MYCHAFKISPLVADINSFVSSPQQKYDLVNDSKQAIKVEVLPALLEKDFSKVSDTSVENDFIIIPDVVTIEPGKTQSIMVRYLGEQNLSSSKTYVINFNQITAFNANNTDSVLKYAINYEAVLNVIPEKAKSKLIVSSIKSLGEKKWELTIDNVGNKHEWIFDTNWEIVSETKKERLAGSEVAEHLNKNFFLPFSTTKAIFTDNTVQGLKDTVNIDIDISN